MTGKTRDRRYYVCTNTHNHDDSNLSGTFWLREDAALHGFRAFVDKYLLGPDRRSHVDAMVTTLTGTRERDRQIQVAQLRTELEDVVSRQQRLVSRLEELENPDRDLVRALQRRHAELSAQRHGCEQALQALDAGEQHDVNPMLVDLLPVGTLNASSTDQMLRKVFELSRLEIRYE